MLIICLFTCLSCWVIDPYFVTGNLLYWLSAWSLFRTRSLICLNYEYLSWWVPKKLCILSNDMQEILTHSCLGMPYVWIYCNLYSWIGHNLLLNVVFAYFVYSPQWALTLVQILWLVSLYCSVYLFLLTESQFSVFHSIMLI